MSRGPPSRSEELSESSRNSQSHNPLDDDANLQTEEVQSYVYSPTNKGAAVNGGAAATTAGGASAASTPASSVKDVQSQLASTSLSPKSSLTAGPANACALPDRPPPLSPQRSVTFHKAGAAGAAPAALSVANGSAASSSSLPPPSPSAAAAAAPIVRTNEMARLELTRTVKVRGTRAQRRRARRDCSAVISVGVE